MPILNQPFNDESLGELLRSKINDHDYTELNIFSAFAKNSGVLRLKDEIKAFRQSGGVVNAFIGVDLCGTSYEALITLFDICSTLTIIHSENSSTYHSKIYSLSNTDSFWYSIGSNNLTLGGLWINFESCYYNETKSKPTISQAQNAIEALRDLYLSGRYDCALPIQKKEDINTLKDSGYVFTEATLHINSKKSIPSKGSKTSKTTSTTLFGKQHVKAPKAISKETSTLLKGTTNLTDKTPKLKMSNTKSPSIDIAALRLSTAKEIFWFEMRKSTGGSRNILDLSKKGRILIGSANGTAYGISDDPQHSWGGVLFFGVDPSDTTCKKDITINYDARDYYPASILYPQGDNANGTWRIQLKGKDVEDPNRKALSEFGREYFVDKILIFEKINDDYFTLSTADNNTLDILKNSSKFWSVNGNNKSNKAYGFIDELESEV